MIFFIICNNPFDDEFNAVICLVLTKLDNPLGVPQYHGILFKDCKFLPESIEYPL